MSPLLDVDHVAGAGRRRTSAPPRSQAAAGVHAGDAMLWLDTGGAVAGDRGAAVGAQRRRCSREWPGTVRIAVSERTPVGVGRRPARARRRRRRHRARARDGRRAAPAGLPQLLGVTVVPPPGGTIDPGGRRVVAGGAHRPGARRAPISVERTDRGVVLHARRRDRRCASGGRRRSRRRSAPRSRCSDALGGAAGDLRRRRACRPTRSPADDAPVV